MSVDKDINTYIELKACIVCKHSNKRLPTCKEHIEKVRDGTGCDKFEVLDPEDMKERRTQLRTLKLGSAIFEYLFDK